MNGKAGSYDNVVETGTRRFLIVLAVMAASLMQTLDSTITNVALPNIQGSLGVSQDEGTWVVTGYTVAALVIIPITPWLQDRFGRRNYYVASIAGFTLASVMCGLSDQIAELIAWRVVQGAFGGGLLATGQSILRDSFSPSKLGTSQGIFAIGAIMGPTLGPPLGGILVDNFSWNFVFFINILPGAISAVLLMLLLKDPMKAQKTPLDFLGLALLIVWVGALQYVITEGEQNYWFADPVICVLTIVCIVAFVAFVVRELFGTRKPVVALGILKNRTVAAGSFLSLVLGVTVFGTAYVLPQFTQGPLGFTPTLSGDLFIVRALPIALATPLIVLLVARCDPRILLALGFSLIGIGCVNQASITTSMASFWTFGFSMITIGLGSSLLFVPLTIAVLGATKPQDGPKASAFINVALQLGGSISVAALTVVLDRRQSLHSTLLTAGTTLRNFRVVEFLQHGSLAQLSAIVNGQALIQSYADVTLLLGVLSFASVPLILLMKRPAKNRGPAKAAT